MAENDCIEITIDSTLREVIEALGEAIQASLSSDPPNTTTALKCIAMQKDLLSFIEASKFVVN